MLTVDAPCSSSSGSLRGQIDKCSGISFTGKVGWRSGSRSSFPHPPLNQVHFMQVACTSQYFTLACIGLQCDESPNWPQPSCLAGASARQASVVPFLTKFYRFRFSQYAAILSATNERDGGERAIVAAHQSTEGGRISTAVSPLWNLSDLCVRSQMLNMTRFMVEDTAFLPRIIT